MGAPGVSAAEGDAAEPDRVVREGDGAPGEQAQRS